jgi:hypothetical protein
MYELANEVNSYLNRHPRKRKARKEAPMSLSEKLASIKSKLDSANGRRRVRTCDMSDVAQAVREAIRDGIGGARGGVVANNYGYPARTTRIATVRLRAGAILVDVGTGNARTNGGYAVHGPSQWNGKCMLRCAAWGESMRDSSLVVVLTRREARDWVAQQSSAAWGELAEDRSILVTTQHSLDAGNCSRETERVAKRIGRDQISAGELWDWCAANESPTLESFVIRAIRQAKKAALA